MNGETKMRPKEGWRKTRRVIRLLALVFGIILIVIVAYGTLLAFPEPLFAHVYSYKNFRVYTREPLDDRARVQLDIVAQRLATSEINDPAITHRVFVAGTSNWYTFFNGPYRRAMGRMYEFHNSLFVPQLDLASGKIVHFDGRRAPMAWILAHEMTHTLTQKKLGIICMWRLPFWKKEGYAEYVAHGRTVPLIEDLRMLDSLTSNVIPMGAGYDVPRQYFEAELLWRYLIEVRKLGFQEVMSDSIELNAVETEMHCWEKAQRN